MRKIKFINPSIYVDQDQVLKLKKIYLPGTALLFLAALTPPEFEVSYTDEFIDDVNFDCDADLICIGLNTYQARRAYVLADEFRRRGKPVILGGIHASLMPNEAKLHADCVAIGEADDIWPEILGDYLRNALSPFYRPAAAPALDKLVIPRLDLLNLKKCGRPPFSKLPVVSIETSRGCPNQCDFCVVGPFHKPARFKPIDKLVQEIQKIGAKYYLFSDSNIAMNSLHAKELFKALIPLGIKWFSAFTVDAGKDTELLTLAVKSGCLAAFLGIESLGEENLRAVNKRAYSLDRYRKLINNFHSCGLPIQASLILGMDYDTEASILEMVRFINANHIDKISLYALTPFPGTVLYNRLLREGRLPDPVYWLNSKKPIYGVHFTPRNFTPERLTEVYWETYQKLLSYSSIFRRLLWPPAPQCINSLVSNLFTRKAVYNKQVSYT
ncbi:MAG: radical SAM protein [Candidatus Margulisiibacteriota bacterium]